MSIEPTCNFCGYSDKNRCKSQEAANECLQYIEKNATAQKFKHLEEDDFGFSFSDDVSDGLPSFEQRLDDMYNAIMPLLDNLSKNPNSKTITWPDRIDRIEQFKEKLLKIKRGKE